MTEEPQVNEWQAPPLPETIKKEEPEMSEVATLFNIFFEPGRTFEDLRRKPRFILATLIVAILFGGYFFGLYYKVGEEGYRNFTIEQINKSPQADKISAADRETALKINGVVFSVLRYVMPLIVILITFVGGLFYFLGGKAFGGNGGFLHGVSVWAYSSLPPLVIGSIANLMVMIFKSADEIDLAVAQRGTLVQANPSLLIDGKAMPVLATLLSFPDLFAIWGWILAAIGLQKINKISSSSAWAITLIFAGLGIIYRLISAWASGNPS